MVTKKHSEKAQKVSRGLPPLDERAQRRFRDLSRHLFQEVSAAIEDSLEGVNVDSAQVKALFVEALTPVFDDRIPENKASLKQRIKTSKEYLERQLGDYPTMDASVKETLAAEFSKVCTTLEQTVTGRGQRQVG